MLRSLAASKGRREHQRFAFEGATLLDEAARSGIPVEEIFATPEVYEATPLIRRLEAGGTAVGLVPARLLDRLSDVETPTGLIAVSPIRALEPRQLLAAAGTLLLLADLGDPGNAGTLLRSAEAFGATGAIFGRLGVDPYHPKVVRGSMGAIFRVPVALADPDDVGPAIGASGRAAILLEASGVPLPGLSWPANPVIVVGHERRGLGRWSGLEGTRAAIPMAGAGESLNAAVAGSIALYQAAQKRA
jgi:TrmH family RNA methyltransferase